MGGKKKFTPGYNYAIIFLVNKMQFQEEAIWSTSIVAR